MQLSIPEIRLDGGTQPRAELDQDTIQSYMSDMESGAQFPPVTVYFDGLDYWLVDGFHRVKAHLQLDRLSVEAEIMQGALADAQWHSYGVNKGHGLRRNDGDKARATQAALRHGKSAGLSDRQIGLHVGVHHSTVGHYRKLLSGESSQIAKEKEDARAESGTGDSQPDTRIAIRNGKEYTMNVQNIGKHAPRVEAGCRVALPRVGTKKRAINENSAKDRFVVGISSIRGACRGIAQLKPEYLLSAMSDDERRSWARTANELARELRGIAKMLSTGDSCEGQ